MKRVPMAARFLSITAVLIIFTAQIHASIYYPQKIGVSCDKKSEFAGICLVLQKTLFTLADSDTNILLYPGDKTDLEALGVKETGAGVVLSIEKKVTNYRAVLYLQKDENNTLLDDSTELTGKDIISSIRPAALKLLSFLKTAFPMVKAEQKTVETVKVGVSEFESAEPAFSIRLTPGFTSFYTGMGLIQSSAGTNSIGNGQSVQFEGLFRCREWNAELGAGLFYFGDSGLSLRLHAGAGYGIFGSLFIIGFDAEYFNSGFNYSGGLAISNIDLTGASLNTILIGPALQFNVTRDYYIKLSAGLPFFLSGSGNLYLTNNTTIHINPNDSSGPPFIDILINFKIAPGWRLNINYLSYSAGVNNINVNGINIQDYFYNLYHLGFGIEYEL